MDRRPGYAYGNWESPRPDAIDKVRREIEAEGKADPEWVASRPKTNQVLSGAYQTDRALRKRFRDALAELLLQSHAGTIEVLPALPTAWPEGEVQGLRARGDVTADIRWRQGKAREIVLHAGRESLLTLHSSLVGEAFELTDFANGKPIAARRTDLELAFRAKA